jgi:hypothetical protein
MKAFNYLLQEREKDGAPVRAALVPGDKAITKGLEEMSDGSVLLQA